MRRPTPRALPPAQQAVLDAAPDAWTLILHLGDSHYALARLGKIELKAIDDGPGWNWRKTPARPQ